jgi:hypothetical protein
LPNLLESKWRRSHSNNNSRPDAPGR